MSAPRPSDQLRGPRIPDALLRELPKTDLLFHLDGSLRPATFVELARESGRDAPADAAAALVGDGSTSASSLPEGSARSGRSLPRLSVGLPLAVPMLVTSAVTLLATTVSTLVSPGATGPAIVPITPSTSSVTAISLR